MHEKKLILFEIINNEINQYSTNYRRNTQNMLEDCVVEPNIFDNLSTNMHKGGRNNV